MTRKKPETTSAKKGSATAAWRKRMPRKATPEELGKLLIAEISVKEPDSDNIKCALALIAKGAPANTTDDDGEPALVLATRHNLVPVIKALLEKGAEVNAPCDRGQTALLVTSYKGYPEAAALLLAHGADPNIPQDNLYPLFLAASYGYTDIVKGLLDHGAHVNVTDSDGQTSLARAAFSGYDDIVKALLDKGADVDLPDNQGKTPLMWTALRGRGSDYVGPPKRLIRIAQMLLEAGADTRPRGDKDRPALMLADENRQREIKALINSTNEKNDREAIANGLPLNKPMTVGKPLQLKVRTAGPS
ncbi:MAG: ankyrin repeat domain-containing protein [Alphaproteobacteria bacterium]